MRGRGLALVHCCCFVWSAVAQPVVVFEVTGAGAGTTASADHIADGMYYQGAPRFPNCQTKPCTTYYKVGDDSYLVDLGTTIGLWTMYAANRGAFVVDRSDLDDPEALPPATGWANSCVGCVGLGTPRLCFPTCAAQRRARMGWTFLVSIGVLSFLYLSLGIVIGKRCVSCMQQHGQEDRHTAKGLLEYHPQYKAWGEGVLLVQDGFRFSWWRLRGAGSEYNSVGDAKAGGSKSAPKPPDSSKRKKKGDRKGKDEARKGKRGRGQERKEKKGKKSSKPGGGGTAVADGGVMLIERKDELKANSQVHSSQQKIKIVVV